MRIKRYPNMTFLGKLQTVADLLKDVQGDIEFDAMKINDQNRLVHAHHIVEMFAIILTNKKEAQLKDE